MTGLAPPADGIQPAASLPAFDSAFDAATRRDLRSDHAGETGAVAIYQGILAVSRDAALRQFATEHLTTETSHLRAFHNWLPVEYHSRLLPIWRAAGWLTGALPALFGSQAVYVTIAAVETFVEQHYNTQIARMENDPLTQPLAVSLASFCADEVAHRRDADRRIGNVGPIGRVWQKLIAIGSRAGVAVARRI